MFLPVTYIDNSSVVSVFIPLECLIKCDREHEKHGQCKQLKLCHSEAVMKQNTHHERESLSVKFPRKLESLLHSLKASDLLIVYLFSCWLRCWRHSLRRVNCLTLLHLWLACLLSWLLDRCCRLGYLFGLGGRWLRLFGFGVWVAIV